MFLKKYPNLLSGAIFVFLLVLPVSSLFSQEIRGRVVGRSLNGATEPLAGADIYFSGTAHGTRSAADGTFTIRRQPDAEWLAARFLGYAPDSIRVGDITIDEIVFTLGESSEQTEAAVVVGAQRGTLIARNTTAKTETISRTGLMKMACCNLSESFENSATVTVGFTDAVSGAKQVQLLGLSGVYSQMLAENVPTMRGLAATYGWSYTPGTWLESIQISKGASSVVNGYESVSGQMNLEFKKPNNTEQLFINLFADDAQRFEANLTAATQVSEKLWTGLLLHGSIEDKVHDNNGDGFLDMPKSRFVNAYNRWFYLDPAKGVESRTGVRFLYDTREGGEAHPVAGQEHYTTNIDNKNITIYNKTGIYIGEREGQSLGIISSFSHHEQNSRFGLKSYDGQQNSFYLNTLFTSFSRDQVHSYTTGISFSYDNYRTHYEDRLSSHTPRTAINRNEVVPGGYAQYTYNPSSKFTFLVGGRADYNSKYGWLFTPRMNLKVDLIEPIIFRVSAGKGYRSPNVIAENIGLLASSREFGVDGISGLDIERAWNFGGNLAFHIPVWAERTLTLSLDYFHTDFQNQAVVDTERDPGHVYFYNLEGRSYADVWQADLTLTLFRGFDFFAAFRYNDTRVTYTNEGRRYRMEKPLTSRYRGLVNLSYATNFRKWVFDVTAQFNGPSRLPSLAGYGAAKEESPAYPVWFAQVTKNTKRFDIYVGVENAFDYTQDNPILNPGDPFGARFDASRIWGPLMGRKVYAGVRLRIGRF